MKHQYRIFVYVMLIPFFTLAIRAQAASLDIAFLLEPPATLDPLMVSEPDEIVVLSMLCDGLLSFEFEAEELTFIPRLATSWDISEDGLHYIFHLRDGLTFADSTPVTADSVMFSLERLQTEPDISESAQLLAGLITSVEKVDDYTILFDLTSADEGQTLLIGLGLPSAFIVSEYSENIAENPMCVGPYILESALDQDPLVLAANPDYYGDEPPYDIIQFTSIESTEAQVDAYLAGEVDIANVTEVIELDPDILSQQFDEQGLVLDENLSDIPSSEQFIETIESADTRLNEYEEALLTTTYSGIPNDLLINPDTVGFDLCRWVPWCHE